MEKNPFNYLFIISLVLLQYFPLYSQSIRNYGKVTGIVSDETSKPVSFASLGLLKAKDSSVVKGSLTDESGLFKFEGVPNGTYILVAGYIPSAESFNAKIKALRSQFRGVRNIDFFMYRLMKIYA